ELAVALGEDGVGPLGEDEEQRGASSATAFRLADHEAVPLEVREVLADCVGGHSEVAGDRFSAGAALAPKPLEDLHAGTTAGDHEGHIRSLVRDARTG